MTSSCKNNQEAQVNSSFYSKYPGKKINPLSFAFIPEPHLPGLYFLFFSCNLQMWKAAPPCLPLETLFRNKKEAGPAVSPFCSCLLFSHTGNTKRRKITHPESPWMQNRKQKHWNQDQGQRPFHIGSFREGQYWGINKYALFRLTLVSGVPEINISPPALVPQDSMKDFSCKKKKMRQ